MIRRARRTTQSPDGHVGYPLLSDVASGASDEDNSGGIRAPLSYIRERSERCTTTFTNMRSFCAMKWSKNLSETKKLKFIFYLTTTSKLYSFAHSKSEKSNKV